MTNEVACASSCTDAGVCDLVAQQLEEGRELWNTALAWLTEKGLEFAVSLLVAVVILLIGWIVIRLVSEGIRKALQKTTKKSKLLGNFIVSVVSKVCWAFLLVTVLSRLGVDVGPLIAGLGVTGFVLGFAFQESLGNLASGMMIAINEPFKVGDYVIVAGLEGTVQEVNMMATILTTADNKRIVIPNKSAWGAPITNFSAMPTRRVDLQVGIAYENDPAKAIAIALETLVKVPGVLKDPAPSVSVSALADSAVTLNVRPWAKGADYWAVYSAAYQAVKAAFEQNGISIPFPQLDVRIEK